MIRRWMVCSFVSLLITSAEVRELTPLEQARKIAPGTRVVVQLTNKKSLGGRLGPVGEDQFRLEPLEPGPWPGKDLLFQDVRKIFPVKQKRTAKDVLLVPVALVAAPVSLLYCGIFRKGC